MAVTRIMPIHATKGYKISSSLSDRIDYGLNPLKTDEGRFVSSFACEPETAVAQFTVSKKQYAQFTGRTQKNNVIAYQLRQSFAPGEITPEEANKIGFNLFQDTPP